METTKPQVIAGVEASRTSAVESAVVSDLVERAKRGDEAAFGDLMRLYERRIIAIGVQMGLSHDDALDACQDTFVKVFSYISRFRSGEIFFRWLYRIAIHAICDHLRWSRPAGVVSIEDIGHAPARALRSGGIPLEAEVEAADLTRKLLSGIGVLSRRERIVFVLRDLQEVRTEEIGRILGLSQITIRRHCMSARRKLRENLFPPEP